MRTKRTTKCNTEFEHQLLWNLQVVLFSFQNVRIISGLLGFYFTPATTCEIKLPNYKILLIVAQKLPVSEKGSELAFFLFVPPVRYATPSYRAHVIT